jgi:drug/metabolite transporter (DMT)-like permease
MRSVPEIRARREIRSGATMPADVRRIHRARRGHRSTFIDRRQAAPGLPRSGADGILMRSRANHLPNLRFDGVANVRHRLEILGAALLFSTGGAAIKATTLDSWQVASFRSGVAALVIVLLMPAARRGWSWPVLPIGVAYAATMVLFVVSNKLTTSANAIFLQDTSPLYVLLASPLLLKEKITRRDVAFMGVVAVGMLLFFVSRPPAAATAPDPRTGNLLAALSGTCWAATILGLRWMGSREGGEGNALPMVVAGNAIACLACLPMALPAHGGAADWAVIGYLGVFQIALAYVLLTAGIRHVPALEASTLLLLEPALNPFWSWLVHGERPGAWSLAGGALILGASIAKTWVDGRPVPEAEAPTG